MASSRSFTVTELEEDYQVLANHLYEEGMGMQRWSETFLYVFKADDEKLYQVYYERGATEYQDSEWPDAEKNSDGEMAVRCPEVEVYEEMVPVKKVRVLR